MYATCYRLLKTFERQGNVSKRISHFNSSKRADSEVGERRGLEIKLADDRRGVAAHSRPGVACPGDCIPSARKNLRRPYIHDKPQEPIKGLLVKMSDEDPGTKPCLPQVPVGMVSGTRRIDCRSFEHFDHRDQSLKQAWPPSVCARRIPQPLGT